MKENANHPYPVPEFIAQLECMNEMIPVSESENIYGDLAELLQICYDVTADANGTWQQGHFFADDPKLQTIRVLNAAYKRLIPLILRGLPGGWFELLEYVKNIEEYPWFDPNEEFLCKPLPGNEVEALSLINI
jgi:hypothetical protein